MVSTNKIERIINLQQGIQTMIQTLVREALTIQEEEEEEEE